MIWRTKLHLSDSDLLHLKWAVANSMLHNPNSQLGVAKGGVWSGPKDLVIADHVRREMQRKSWDASVVSYKSRSYCSIREMWGNIIVAGGSIDPHDHNDGINVVVGILYLTKARLLVTESQLPDYLIHITRPHDLKLEPLDLVFMRPDVMHSVPESNDPDPRISIAFNMI